MSKTGAASRVAGTRAAAKAGVRPGAYSMLDGARLRYWFDNMMSKGTASLIGFLALISLVIVLFGGSLVYLLDPTPDGDPQHHRGLVESVWLSMLHALDPGTVAGDSGHWWFVAIGLFITVCGILTVTALIGVITTGLDAKLVALRKGKSVVVEHNHTVLLGWSDQTFTVISELVEANSNHRRACIAVLAERDKVVVLCGDEVDDVQVSDSRSLVTLLHLRDMEQRAGGRPLSVVSEMADDRNRVLAQITEADDYIVSENIPSLMMTQISENPLLSTVFASLFEPDGSEIYLKPVEPYVRLGQTINFQTVVEAARLRGESAIGYRVGANESDPPGFGIVLNPDKADSIVLRPGDRVIVLAEN